MLSLLGYCCLLLAAEPVAVWDSEAEAIDWRPRDKTIAVERVPGAGRDGSAGLRIAGSITPGWNYAISGNRPLQAGENYRLSAWVKVDQLGEQTPAPFLKCEFIPAEQGKELGRVSTSTYERHKLGTWQELTINFAAPAGTANCWLALEKGTNGPCVIEAVLDNVALTPVTRADIYAEYQLSPLPKPLAAALGHHPRLFLNAAKVSELKRAIGGTHRELWTELQAQADRYVASGPPAYREQDSYSGNEQLWQRDVGNAMGHIAMAWLLTGDPKYVDSARDWALASCGYVTWGLGSTDGMDLAAGHQLLGLALVYDWCFADLGEPARTTIRETLIRRGGAMFEAAAGGRAWWRNSYLQNHLWVDACGLAAAGLAIADEYDEGLWWAGSARQKFETTANALGPDGASHEGIGYWQYGVEYLLKFNALAKELLDVDLGDRPWWRHTAKYALHLTIPRNAWTVRSSLVDIADCPRGNWYGPDILLRRLAALNQDPVAQWQAAEVDDANIEGASARWLNLIWYDPTLKPTPPTGQPTLHHFEDMDIVAARTDWSGDETLLVAKCGPYIGHEAVASFRTDPGGGHVHPDANHFVLFGQGEWLIRDDGYQQKATAQHNTLVIDGRGQVGEGQMWFAGSPMLGRPQQPHIVAATSTPALDTIVGDATAAYPAELGLKQFRRTWLFAKPDVLLVVDDIATDRARALELRFHPEAQPEAGGANVWLAKGKQSILRLELLTPQQVTSEAGNFQALGRHEPTKMPAVRLTKQGASWRNVMALSWSAADGQPAAVTLSADGKSAMVRGRAIALPE